MLLNWRNGLAVGLRCWLRTSSSPPEKKAGVLVGQHLALPAGIESIKEMEQPCGWRIRACGEDYRLCFSRQSGHATQHLGMWGTTLQGTGLWPGPQRSSRNPCVKPWRRLAHRGRSRVEGAEGGEGGALLVLLVIGQGHAQLQVEQGWWVRGALVSWGARSCAENIGRGEFLQMVTLWAVCHHARTSLHSITHLHRALLDTVRGQTCAQGTNKAGGARCRVLSIPHHYFQ